MNRVCIIGAGASGLTAAIAAARSGASVTVLEHGNQIGKKISLTGNGRCNLTNTDQNLNYYHGGSRDVIAKVLGQFSLADTLQFFTGLGIYTKNRNGYLYPNSDEASNVADVLRMEARRLKVKISCNAQIDHISCRDGHFSIETPGWTYEADRVILCTGSKAAPQTGSDGSGYRLAETFGHTIVEPLPALVQLRADGGYFGKLAGVRTEAKISLLVDEKLVASKQGELQLTGYGLSGIPIFQLSRYASRALHQGKKVEAVIHFLPGFTPDMLTAFYRKRMEADPEKTGSEFFTGLLHKKLAAVLLHEANLRPEERTAGWSRDQIEALVRVTTGFRIRIQGTNSFEQAQVCTGGVSLEEVDGFTLESRLAPGLYFAGELLDVDGACGGYNLQWAWSSGWVSGTHAASADGMVQG